jgi:hypothetical protein
MAQEGESFSGAVTRLIEAGATALRGGIRPSYVGAGEGGATRSRPDGREVPEGIRLRQVRMVSIGSINAIVSRVVRNRQDNQGA